MTGTVVTAHQRRLNRLAAIRRQRALLDHDETVLLAAIAADPDPYPGDPLAAQMNWVRDEVSALLLIAPTTAAVRLHTATQIVERFPRMLDTLSHGEVPGYYATRLIECTDGLTDEHAAEVEKRVMPRAAAQTISQFTRTIRRAVATVDPTTAQDKHARGRQDRRVVFNPVQDNGTVELWTDPPPRALTPVDAFQPISRTAVADTSSVPSPRADALCTLGSDTAPVKTQINVTVALSSLLGLDDQPADLDGDPVAATIARTVAFHPDSRWRRLLVDHGGRLIDATSENYRPPTPISRFVHLRDRTCQFATCQRTAARCDDHHLHPWTQGGPTCPRNLIALCPRHHHLRHDADWTLTRTENGTAVWTSRSGRVYRRPPPEPPPH